MNDRSAKKSSLRKVFAWGVVLAAGALWGFAPPQADAQLLVKEKLSVGFRGGGLFGATELDDKLGPQFNIFLRRRFNANWTGEVSTGYSRFNGSNYGTDVGNLAFRTLFTPVFYQNWNPFLYAGFTALRYDLDKIPPGRSTDIEAIGWKANFPLGIGAQLLLLNNVALELSGGYNLVASDAINGSDLKSGGDNFWGVSAGITVGNLGSKRDRPFRLPAEYIPPTARDSDDDGLSDDLELTVFYTDPNKADSDGDGLSDGDEAKVYKTNPNKADSDDGGELDGQEVALGINPLDGSDDVPLEERGLPGIEQASFFAAFYFATDKDELSAMARRQLDRTAERLLAQPGTLLEIRGFADDVGSPKYNTRLSQRRAETVKTYLVERGIEAWRLTARGLGEDREGEMAAESRQQSRRVEIETVAVE